MWRDPASSQDALQSRTKRTANDNFSNPTFQCARHGRKKNREEQIRDDEPKIDVGSVELPINQKTQGNEIEDDGRGNESSAEPDAGEAFRAAVIFGHGLQRDAPPKISVNLNVPLIPTGIGGIAPAFFLEQLEHGTKQMMTVPSLFAPKNSAAQTTGKIRTGRQMFVRPNHIARRALKVQPGEITRKSSHERLSEGQKQNEQTGMNGVELRFDPRPHHVRERNAERAAKHQIRDNAQHRQKNPKTKKKNREREPFDTAQINGHVRLRCGIDRLKKTVAENSMINHRAVDEPTEARRSINLAAPFRCSGRAEEDQMFEAQQRFRFAIAVLLF